MHKRFQALLMMAVVAMLVLAGSQWGDRAAATATTASAELSSLPASDIIIFVDTQRLISDTLPNFLANDPTLLAKVNARLDRFQRETGIDPRSFDSLSIGLRFNDAPARGDFKCVAIAHGGFNAASVIETAYENVRKRKNIGREE